MVIGDMRHKITVKRLTTTRDPNNGSIVETWGDEYILKAKRLKGNGTKTIENNEIFNTQTKTFVTHYRDVTEKDRIYYDDDWYKIMLLGEIGYRDGLEIVVEKINE